jgi:hypothetical protein
MRRSRWAAAGLALLITGCGASPVAQGGPPRGSGPPPATRLPPPRATCGTTRTAVNVPVIIEIEKGAAPCSLAMRVQRDYTEQVRAGHVRGTGGGAPVRVDGWTCQGQATPTIVRTGEASQCRRDGTEIVAVLDLRAAPAPSASGR